MVVSHLIYLAFFFSADSVKHLRSNNTNKLKVPRIRTKFGARAFSVSGPTLWNLLPAHLRGAKNISSFRKLLKMHFPDDDHAYFPRLFFGI